MADRSMIRNPTLAATLVLAAVLLAAPAPADGVDAQAAFEQLKGLAGTWQAESAEQEGAYSHVFQVSANGTVVMETMAPGTANEMINMYHLDGDDLVLTHYCSGGNQPTMRLDREASGEQLVFTFTGGSNLDPATDGHIHAARFQIADPDHVDAWWTAYNEGEAAGDMHVSLTRQRGE